MIKTWIKALFKSSNKNPAAKKKHLGILTQDLPYSFQQGKKGELNRIKIY
jgi:hypothetical protein